MGYGERGCPWPGAKAKTSSQGQDVVFREATLQAAREILEPHNFMCFQWALSPLILVPSLVQASEGLVPNEYAATFTIVCSRCVEHLSASHPGPHP